MILCNPHNPVGRIWTQTELQRVAEICERHTVFVISDEIHGDFAFPPHQFTPYLNVLNKHPQNGASCLSTAKTFNIAGMVDAITVIPNETDRHQFREFGDRYQINKINVFSTLAMETAYREGDEWLDALIVYIQGNVDLIRYFLQKTLLAYH